MEIFKSIAHKTANDALRMIVTACHCCHKFMIDVDDVFGGADKVCLNAKEWFTNKPEDVTTWLRPPYDLMYLELHGIKELTKPLGVLLITEGDCMKIIPLLVKKPCAHGTGVVFTVGIKGPLTVSDFDDPNDYYNWVQGDTTVMTDRVCALLSTETIEAHQNAQNASAYLPLILESLLYINARGIGTTTNIPKNIKPRIRNSIRKNKIKAASTSFTYKTLRIIKKGEPKNTHNTDKSRIIPFFQTSNREHTVRGHVAIYTRDNPRFGRHHKNNIGPQWISPHVRCRGTEGKIIKDYEVQ